MCGRFYIIPDAELNQFFAPLALTPFQDLPLKLSGEIFPTDIVPVFIWADGKRTAKPMIWGFPKWDHKGVIFNARQESALEKKMFRQPLLERRCAVLTTGFFEWTPVPGQKRKDRYIFTLLGEKWLFLAGIWSVFSDPLSGQIPERFTILTTEANEGVSHFHDRMPVILAESEVDDWLTGDDFTKYMNRAQPTLEAKKSNG